MDCNLSKKFSDYFVFGYKVVGEGFRTDGISDDSDARRAPNLLKG